MPDRGVQGAEKAGKMKGFSYEAAVGLCSQELCPGVGAWTRAPDRSSFCPCAADGVSILGAARCLDGGLPPKPPPANMRLDQNLTKAMCLSAKSTMQFFFEEFFMRQVQLYFTAVCDALLYIVAMIGSISIDLGSFPSCCAMHVRSCMHTARTHAAYGHVWAGKIAPSIRRPYRSL